MTLKDFFPDKIAMEIEVEFAVSDRMPAFKIAAVDEAKAAQIRAGAIKRARMAGAEGIDSEANMLGLVIACTKFPELESATLQEAWSVVGAESLLQKMLLPGEYARLSEKVAEICGFDNEVSELVEKAKN